MGIGPGSMYGLGQVQCVDWARFNARHGPGSMQGLGQVQCKDWARFNIDIGPNLFYSGSNVWIGPGSMLTLNWHTFGNLAARMGITMVYLRVTARDIKT